MGFWNFLWDWFARLFGPPQSPAELELSFGEVHRWMAQQAQTEQTVLFERLNQDFARIRFLLMQLTEQLKALQARSSDLPEASARLLKVVASSQQLVVDRLFLLSEKLQPPRTQDVASIQAYCESSGAVFQKEIGILGKNIAYTNLLLRDELKELGAVLLELENVLSRLHEPFLQPVWKDRERSNRLVLEVTELQKKSSGINANIAALKGQLQNLFVHQATLQNELQLLDQSQDYSLVSETNRQLEDLRTQKRAIEQSLLDRVFAVDKPLRRFNQLVNANQWVLEKKTADFLVLFAQKPLSALESDPKGELTKEVLREISRAIDEQKLGFKDEKEKNRHVAAIQQLLAFDFFSEFFWKQNDLVRRQNQLQKQLDQNPALKTMASKREQLAQFSDRLRALQADLNLHENALEKNRQAIEEKTVALQNCLAKIARQPVRIRL